MIGKSDSFPATYSDIGTSKLMEAYAAGPEHVRKVLAGLTESDLLAQPRSGKWSIKQIVFHLADSEIVGWVRIKLAFAQPGSTFPFYSQAVWAETFDYQRQDRRTFDEVLSFFELARSFSGSIFRRAHGDDWKKNGIHPEFGEMTLRQLLELYADHSERHIEQILAIRKLLGQEMKFPLMLEKRLY